MNWEDLRYFQAIARAGTLSGAARMLGVHREPQAGGAGTIAEGTPG